MGGDVGPGVPGPVGVRPHLPSPTPRDLTGEVV